MDSITRTGDALAKAVDSLNRTQLRALADRLDLTYRHGTEDLKRAIKRRLLGVQR